MVLLTDHVEALATAYIKAGKAQLADALVCSLPIAASSSSLSNRPASILSTAGSSANEDETNATARSVPKAVTSACQGVAMDAQMLSIVIGAVP